MLVLFIKVARRWSYMFQQRQPNPYHQVFHLREEQPFVVLEQQCLADKAVVITIHDTREQYAMSWLLLKIRRRKVDVN